MADIIVTGFRQGYEKARTEDGKEVLVECDWVSWVPINSPQSTGNEDKVRRLDPEKALAKLPEGTDGGEKIGYMRTIWAAVEPAYRAWKEGRELPLNGTPLAAWPGITPETAEVFRLAGVRTVEAVRDMSEGLRAKVRLPNVRELQELAKLYLENTGATAAAEREAAKDRQIAEMQENTRLMAERMAAMEEMLATLKPTAAEGEDEIAQLRAALEAEGIEYDKRWGANKLREALNQRQAA